MQTTILQLAISLIFLYLMLSAACSAIQEIIANALRWRASTLEDGIEGLLQSKTFKDELYKLPLLKGLCSPNARGDRVRPPSYIAPSTFALAVLDLATQKGLLAASGVESAAVNANPTPGVNANAAKPSDENSFSDTTKLLRSLLAGANTVEEQRKRLEGWFNDSMDRVSGWYKRKSHAWLWVISVALCLALNADSISLGEAFWNDAPLRAATTAAATSYVQSRAKGKGGSTGSSNNQPDSAQGATKLNPINTNTTDTQNTSNVEAPATVQTAKSTGSSSAASTTGGDQAPDSKDAFRNLDEVKTELAKAEIPLGWCVSSQVGTKWELSCWPDLSGKKDATTTQYGTLPPDPRLIPPFGWSWFFLKLLGIALTALAISQGAPFWFDLLQKAVNLRLAGDAPDEKKQGK